jgi:hypothetical protein
MLDKFNSASDDLNFSDFVSIFEQSSDDSKSKVSLASVYNLIFILN